MVRTIFYPGVDYFIIIIILSLLQTILKNSHILNIIKKARLGQRGLLKCLNEQVLGPDVGLVFAQDGFRGDERQAELLLVGNDPEGPGLFGEIKLQALLRNLA